MILINDAHDAHDAPRLMIDVKQMYFIPEKKKMFQDSVVEQWRWNTVQIDGALIERDGS